MTAHRQQAFLGYLILALGLGLVGLATAPTVIGMNAHPAVQVPVALTLLFVGLAVVILGALLIPSSGAGPVVTQFFALIAPWAPRQLPPPPPSPPPPTGNADP